MSRKLRVLPPVIPAVTVRYSPQAERVATAFIESAVRAKWDRSLRRVLFAEIVEKLRAVVREDGSVRLIAAGERVEAETPRKPITYSPAPKFRGDPPEVA